MATHQNLWPLSPMSPWETSCPVFPPKPRPRLPSLQGNLFSLQTPRSSTCRWNHSRCWRTTSSRSTAPQRPTQLSPSTGKSPAKEAPPGHWTPPHPCCLSRRVSIMALGTQHSACFATGVQDPSPFPAHPSNPWPGRLFLSLTPMTFHARTFHWKQEVFPLLSGSLVYPFSLKRGRKAQGKKKVKTTRKSSKIRTQILAACLPNRSPAWGKTSGAAGPIQQAPRIVCTLIPCAPLARNADKSTTVFYTLIFPC